MDRPCALIQHLAFYFKILRRYLNDALNSLQVEDMLPKTPNVEAAQS